LNTKKNYFFLAIFFIVTIFISIIGFKPAQIVIIGPEFHEQKYFIEELDIISKELNIKIKYKSVNDPETYIINNKNLEASIALMPNPQGVTNLAEKDLIYSLNNIMIDGYSIKSIYPRHLIDIVSVNQEIFAGWTRLLPNSLIWYDISKINQYKNIKFESFDSLILETNKIADNGGSPWCANSESSASTGWIQTNWLEDVILSKHGPDIYDKWSRLEISASSLKIYSSMKVISDFIFYPNHIQGGDKEIINKEFRNLPLALLNDNNPCFLTWSGHYFRYYIPENFRYGIDYGVSNFPPINYKNSIVGIGDNVVLLKNDTLAQNTISKMLSSDFGMKWASYEDAGYISVNQNFNKEIIKNKLTKYEFELVHRALENDLFRYDASEIMARPIGSNLLWKFFRELRGLGPESLINLLNELDNEI
tara:strand:+ start:628 stop:1890 length:1263 start_codon:yes stop_codon:yes gene_type:complete